MSKRAVCLTAATILTLCLTLFLTPAIQPRLLAQSDDLPALPDVRLVWSPDGEVLAVIHRGGRDTPDDEIGTYIYHLDQPEDPDFYMGREEVRFAGNRLAASYAALENTGEVLLWDPATGRIENTLPGFFESTMAMPAFCPMPKYLPRQLDFSYDGRMVARPERDGTVSLFSPQSSELISGLASVACPVVDVAFSSEGSQIATLHTNQAVQMFSAFSGQRLWQFVTDIEDALRAAHGADSVPYRLAFSPRGNQLAVFISQADGEGAVMLLDAETGELIASISAALPADHRVHLAYTPNGESLLISDALGLRLFDGASQFLRVEYPLAGRQQAASSIAFSPDGSRVAYYDFETASVLFLDGRTLTPIEDQQIITAFDAQTAVPEQTSVALQPSNTPTSTTVPATETSLPTFTPTFLPTLTPTVEVPAATSTEAAPTTPPSETPVPSPTEAVCVNAPPSRLTAGIEAQVTFPTESNFPHTLRVRATPNGDIIGVLISGNRLRITGGSICENNLLWWPVETLDGTVSGWSAEGQAPDVYYLEPTS